MTFGIAGTSRTSRYDIAIVGGGPAGASLAIHLVRREGVSPDRIVIVDKARFPREKPCAGAISQFGVDCLAAIGVSIDVPALTMQGVRILARESAGETAFPMGVLVRRDAFDHHLLETARALGVTVRDGEGLLALARTPKGFVLRVGARAERDSPEAAIDARFVAACDGAGSTTRKLLGLREPDRKGHLYVLENDAGAADEAVKRGVIDFDLSILEDGLEGYYWDFPTPLDGTTKVSRGIYHANFSPRSDVKAVLARHLARRGVDIARVRLKPFSTRPFVARTTTWVRGVVFVGEAAGIDQTTGEGIAQAIAMGGIAAPHLARALVTGDRAFYDYDRAVRSSTVGRHLLQSAFLAPRVYGRFGGPAKRYLLQSEYARASAMRWYHGQALSLGTQLRLGLGLARAVV